jgi:hypothetical protein
MAAVEAGSASRRRLTGIDTRAAVISGIAIWAVTFVAAMVIFPLHAEERPLFESIMPVVLATATVVASCHYFVHLRTQQGLARHGLVLGATWFAVNLALDGLMFSRGPMQMAPGDYFKDIGITYLMIVVIPAGFGYLADAWSRR